MAKKNTTQEFNIDFPKYEKGQEDTMLSFDRFDHRNRLYGLEDHIIVHDTTLDLLVKELQSQRQQIHTLQTALKDMAKKGGTK